MFVSDFVYVDIEYYRRENPDLANFSDTELHNHYSVYGYKEGRASSAEAYRENFLGKYTEIDDALEIGPFCSPLPLSRRIKYFDILDYESLCVRADNLYGLSARVPKIDYTSSDGSLRTVDAKFELTISSHCIEHQPDIVTHLNEVYDVLKPGGVYAMLIPNAAYCFDASLPLSSIADVLDAHSSKRKKHTLASFVEHHALTTHNDTMLHWIHNATRTDYRPIDVEKVKSASEAFYRTNGGYEDVHAWQFSPISFSDIINCLIKIKVVKFSKLLCNGPVFGRNEFTATLLK